MSDLFRPQTFLNALRQETARHTREALVSLDLVSSLRNPPVGAAVYVCVVGLLLQGATVDGDTLSELSESDAPVAFRMPDVYLAWMPPKKVGDGAAAATTAPQAQSVVPVPVYTNLSKDSLLCELKMKVANAVDVPKFILAGTAMALEA